MTLVQLPKVQLLIRRLLGILVPKSFTVQSCLPNTELGASEEFATVDE